MGDALRDVVARAHAAPPAEAAVAVLEHAEALAQIAQAACGCRLVERGGEGSLPQCDACGVGRPRCLNGYHILQFLGAQQGVGEQCVAALHPGHARCGYPDGGICAPYVELHRRGVVGGGQGNGVLVARRVDVRQGFDGEEGGRGRVFCGQPRLALHTARVAQAVGDGDGVRPFAAQDEGQGR